MLPLTLFFKSGSQKLHKNIIFINSTPKSASFDLLTRTRMTVSVHFENAHLQSCEIHVTSSNLELA